MTGEGLSKSNAPCREIIQLFGTDKHGTVHELKVDMRALGFDLKKAEAIKTRRLRDHDKKGHGLLEYDECVLNNNIPFWRG